jgi:hypothetical protein
MAQGFGKTPSCCAYTRTAAHVCMLQVQDAAWCTARLDAISKHGAHRTEGAQPVEGAVDLDEVALQQVLHLLLRLRIRLRVCLRLRAGGPPCSGQSTASARNAQAPSAVSWRMQPRGLQRGGESLRPGVIQSSGELGGYAVGVHAITGGLAAQQLPGGGAAAGRAPPGRERPPQRPVQAAGRHCVQRGQNLAAACRGLASLVVGLSSRVVVVAKRRRCGQRPMQGAALSSASAGQYGKAL